MPNLKQRMAENRGLQVPCLTLDSGDGPIGQETVPGPGPNPSMESLRALLLPTLEKLQERMRGPWEAFVPSWEEAVSRLLEKKAQFEHWDNRRITYQQRLDLGRISQAEFNQAMEGAITRLWASEEEPEAWTAVSWELWPRYLDHPLSKHLAKPVVSWKRPKPILPAHFMEPNHPRDLQKLVQALRPQVIAQALEAENWNLVAIPVAGYTREQPLRWIHCRLPEGVMPVENQALDLFTGFGRPVGSALVRFPPMACPSATLQRWIQDDIPMLIALPH